MEKVNSPLEAEILLWYHHSPEDFPNFDAPAVQQAIDGFCDLGLMERVENSDRKIKPNWEALECFVNKVMALELPKNVWM